jgi:hypothetical protein
VGKRDVFSKDPVLLEGNLVKEPEAPQQPNVSNWAPASSLLLVREVDLIAPDVFAGLSIRGRSEVACEQRNLLEIRRLRMR